MPTFNFISVTCARYLDLDDLEDERYNDMLRSKRERSFLDGKYTIPYREKISRKLKFFGKVLITAPID